MYGCAKYMGISRTTAIKWFESMRWDDECNKHYWQVRKWVLSHLYEDCRYDSEACANDLGYAIDEVRLGMEMFKIEPRYIMF